MGVLSSSVSVQQTIPWTFWSWRCVITLPFARIQLLKITMYTEIGIQPYSQWVFKGLFKGLQQIKKTLYRKKQKKNRNHEWVWNVFLLMSELSAVLFSCLYFCFILYSPKLWGSIIFCLKPVAYWWGCMGTDCSLQNRLWRGFTIHTLFRTVTRTLLWEFQKDRSFFFFF